MNQTVAGDEAIAIDDFFIHAEIAGTVADELVQFFKRAFVEEEVDTLTRGEFAFFVLARTALFAAPRFGVRVTAANFF